MGDPYGHSHSMVLIGKSLLVLERELDADSYFMLFIIFWIRKCSTERCWLFLFSYLYVQKISVICMVFWASKIRDGVDDGIHNDSWTLLTKLYNWRWFFCLTFEHNEFMCSVILLVTEIMNINNSLHLHISGHYIFFSKKW